MITINIEKLVKNLSRIPEEEFDPDERKKLKILFLVLAGDQRVINKLSLEDMAGLFEDAADLLGYYSNCLEYQFSESLMEDYADAVRRAV